MTADVTRSRWPRGPGWPNWHSGTSRPTILERAVSIGTAAVLAIDAYVHFDDAHFYDFDGGAALTQGSLFRAQASLAVVVAILVLVWPSWLSWALAFLVSASAAGAVLLYTYVDVGKLGPLPNMYEPTWALPGKRASCVAELVAVGLSAVGFGLALWRRSARRQAPRAQSRSSVSE
jgi:hypothetical protein